MTTPNIIETAHYEYKVVESDLASGTPVLKTSRLVEIADLVSAQALQPLLQKTHGCEISICTRQDFKHTFPVPLGATVTASASYLGREGTQFNFKIDVCSSDGTQVYAAALTRAFACWENIVAVANLRRFRRAASDAIQECWGTENSKTSVTLSSIHVDGNPDYQGDPGSGQGSEGGWRYLTCSFHHALAHGPETLVEAWLQSGVDLAAFNQQGCNPLHIAACHSTARVVNRLLDFGADIDARIEGGFSRERATALLLAWEAGNSQTFQALLRRGADPFIPRGGGTRSSKSFHEVVIQEDRFLMAALLATGGDIEETDTYESWTPLMTAVSRNRSLSFVDFLVKQGASIRATDDEWWTPLHFAVEEDNASLARVLLDHGADPYAKTCWGDTAPQMAAKNARRAAVQLFQDRGIDFSLGSPVQEVVEEAERKINGNRHHTCRPLRP